MQLIPRSKPSLALLLALVGTACAADSDPDQSTFAANSGNEGDGEQGDDGSSEPPTEPSCELACELEFEACLETNPNSEECLALREECSAACEGDGEPDDGCQTACQGELDFCREWNSELMDCEALGEECFASCDGSAGEEPAPDEPGDEPHGELPPT